MKWILKRCLLAAPAIIFYSLFSFHACLISGCSTDTTGHGGGPRTSGTPPSELRLSAVSSTDSSATKATLHTAGKIPAGSSLVLVCTTPKDCKFILSTDSTAHNGGVKMLVLGTFTEDVPDNTELVFRIITKENPAIKK